MSEAPPPSDKKPKFLQAADPETWPKPEDVSWGDWSLKPGKALNSRQKELARLLFLGKNTQVEIAAQLGYSEPWVCRLAQSKRVQDEVERLRNLAFEKTVVERVKELGPAAMDVIEEALLDEHSGMKLKDRAELAIWVAEKLDGKAVQKSETKDSTLDRFFDILSDMRQRGEILDVSPTPVGEAAHSPNIPKVSHSAEGSDDKPEPSLSRWVDENL